MALDTTTVFAGSVPVVVTHLEDALSGHDARASMRILENAAPVARWLANQASGYTTYQTRVDALKAVAVSILEGAIPSGRRPNGEAEVKQYAAARVVAAYMAELASPDLTGRLAALAPYAVELLQLSVVQAGYPPIQSQAEALAVLDWYAATL